MVAGMGQKVVLGRRPGLSAQGAGGMRELGPHAGQTAEMVMVPASRPRDAGVARGSEFEDWLQARWANRRGVGGCSKSGHGTVGSEPKWRQVKKA